MAGRYTTPLLAGIFGVVSGIWIFEPLIRDSLKPEKPPVLVPSDQEAGRLKTYGLPSYSNEEPGKSSQPTPAKPLEGIPPVSPSQK